MNFWETILCAFLATCLALILGCLYMIGAFRKRRPKEPPLDKGFLPWLGYAMDFRRNAAELLERMKKKHGDIFTLLVGGNYLHFVMDPFTYGTLIKESKEKLDFDTFASTIVFNAFGFQPTESHHKVVQAISKKNLRGKGLAVLNQLMMEKLQMVMLHNQDSEEGERPWQQDGVFHFSFKTIFQAAFLVLFGTEPSQDVEGKEKVTEHYLTQCEELCEKFQKYDNIFPAMALGMQDPVGKNESQNLKNFFWDVLSIEKIYQKDNISSWVVEQDQMVAELGFTEKMRTQFQFLLLWASQANTGPATSWFLAYLLKHPEAMKAVREEVYNVLQETGQEVEVGSSFISVSLDKIKTPVLDSAIEETLRLKASPFLFRSVVQDMDVKMSDGREYILRKGDQLLLFPFVGLQMDPEIHPDPQTFKYDRFLNPDGTKKVFSKNGKKLKHHSMPWGAGPSMCPGRFFAVSEIKLFAILMLRYFDMELVNGEEEIPPIDTSRYGFGVMHPTSDIQFKFRVRETKGRNM